MDATDVGAMLESVPTGSPQTRPEAPAAEAGKRFSRRIPFIDGLRILAALAVLSAHFIHVNSHLWGPGTRVFVGVANITTYGRFGVDLFFLISGFVICMSGWNRTVGEFAVARFVRLYPIYWIAVLVTGLVMKLEPHVFGPTRFTDIVTNLTLFQRPLGVPNVDGVYWTLRCELQFYLLFAFLVWRGLTYRRVVVFCVLGLIASTMGVVANSRLVLEIVDPVYLPYFIGGIAFYLIYRFGPNLQLWLLVFGSWLLVQHTLLEAKGGRFDYTTWHPSHLTMLALMTLIYAVIAVAALHWTDWIRWRWLRPAGAMTYPLYLLHVGLGFPLIYVLSHGAMRHVNSWVLFALVTLTMLALAYVVQRWVEKPIATRMNAALKRTLANAGDPGDPGAPRVPAPRVASPDPNS
ncbi:acyltransferase family protein [Actinospica robiniae]|uniref:acyltransferase family protein n=1 Tax=Actinospica robiniae TaxID=304901 RepID=UPI000400471B|nr:acyltransferase [Actinospica robiniae]